MQATEQCELLSFMLADPSGPMVDFIPYEIYQFAH